MKVTKKEVEGQGTPVAIASMGWCKLAYQRDDRMLLVFTDDFCMRATCRSIGFGARTRLQNLLVNEDCVMRITEISLAQCGGVDWCNIENRLSALTGFVRRL